MTDRCEFEGEAMAQCKALGCFAFALGEENGAVCPWTCAEHQDFFLFSNWMQNFGPMVYNRQSLPAETNLRMRAYIEHCLLHCVRGITPELLQAMYFSSSNNSNNRNNEDEEGDEERDEEGIFPGSELLIAKYLSGYFKILFRRPDVSPAWNTNLLSVFVKSGILACLPHRLSDGGLLEELRPFLHHPLVRPTDILHILARLRHSHPQMFALHITREVWQEILENLIVPELLGPWIGCKDILIRAGETAVRSAVPYPEKFNTDYSQWKYETECHLLAYVDLCTSQAAHNCEAIRDELLAVTMAPGRVVDWCMDADTIARWRSGAGNIVVCDE